MEPIALFSTNQGDYYKVPKADGGFDFYRMSGSTRTGMNVNDVSRETGISTDSLLSGAQTTTPAAPTSSGSYSSPSYTSAPAPAPAPAPVLNQAAVSATQQAIDSLNTEQNVAYGNVDRSYDAVKSRYDYETGRNEADYNDQTVTNNQNLTRNKQNALVAGAQGRRGLRSTLAAIGALSGDGAKLADRAVTQGVNADVGEAAETFSNNAVTLDKAIGNYRDEDKQRRAEAETARNNQRLASEGQIMSKRQQMYQKMAELFSEGGRTADAAKYLGMAGGLNEGIAQRSAVAATPMAARAAAFTPGKLAEYLAGAGDMTVAVAPNAPGTGVGPTILAGRRPKRDERELALT